MADHGAIVGIYAVAIGGISNYAFLQKRGTCTYTYYFGIANGVAYRISATINGIMMENRWWLLKQHSLLVQAMRV